MAVELFPLVEPVVAATGVELVDVEYRSGVVLVTIDRPDGVDLEILTTVNRVVSELLDARDPIPGTYTLEVSSPGVERTLRRPAHFTRAVGETISVKTRPQVPGNRRLTGRLAAADEQGIELEVEGHPDGRVRLAYSDLDRARTVFAWGGAPKPGAKQTTTTTKTQKRKQVTTP
jgi:ribosome maturation factor RimP